MEPITLNFDPPIPWKMYPGNSITAITKKDDVYQVDYIYRDGSKIRTLFNVSRLGLTYSDWCCLNKIWEEQYPAYIEKITKEKQIPHIEFYVNEALF